MKLTPKFLTTIIATIAILVFTLLLLSRSDSPQSQAKAKHIQQSLKQIQKYLSKAQGPDKERPTRYFRRAATFPVFLNTDIENEAVSEIVSATKDGMTLVYTDSSQEQVGFVDISDIYAPEPDGVVPLAGEPTSVTVVDDYVLACINTSESFTDTSGRLIVIDINTRSIVREIELGGQPDAIAASPDGRYAGIIIENERDEDLEVPPFESPPQAPSGFVVIVDLVGGPAGWSTRTVSLDGIADKFPEDAEPEYIDINRKNIAAVSLQENNHIVLIDLPSGNVVKDFSAGTADLTQIDTNENDLIEQSTSLNDVPREPDAITWIGDHRIGTADEGDLEGGSRGFTIFNRHGQVRFTSGSNDDHLMAMIGHYPEGRSENKGNEPEGIEYAQFGRDHLLFVGSERSSVVSVYQLNDRNKERPKFIQALPAGIGPEGILAIPSRNILVVASEEDDRGDKFRSSITIYKRGFKQPTYPTVASEDKPDGTPIPWAALSALAAHPSNPNRAWTAYDSFYKKSRIFRMDVSDSPALIEKEIVLKDSRGKFSDAIAAANAKGYTDIVEANLINDDLTVNIDPEGLARRPGGFWLASEGNGTVGDDSRPIRTQNWLFKVANNGSIREVVGLPDELNAKQVRFGFEGVTSTGKGSSEVVYVCIQREWTGDPDNHVRIGRYEAATGEWTFFYYPIDEPTSPNGGWVGLSEIVALSDTDFLILERDNQAGLDARIKKIYYTSTDGLTPLPEASTPGFPVLNKTEVRDLLPDLLADNGSVIEKVEGLAALANGDLVIVTDNDGVDDSSGETQFINLGPVE